MPILFLIYPIYTFTAITTILIYTRTHGTLSVTAFVAVALASHWIGGFVSSILTESLGFALVSVGTNILEHYQSNSL